MTNAIVVDLTILLAIGIAFVRGWTHRSIREFFSLLGLAAGLALVPFLTGPLADLIGRLDVLDVNVARSVAAGFVIAMTALIGAIFGVRTSRAVTPQGPARLDAAGGAMFAFLRGIVVTALILFVILEVAPEAEGEDASLRTAVADSVSGQLLAHEDSPFTIVYDGIVRRSPDLQALALWTRQRSGFRERVPGNNVALTATNEKLDPVGSAEKKMLELVNVERADRGLEPLGWCADCASVARAHSKDMYRHGYFSHVDTDGTDPFDRMVTAGITYGAAGENLSIAPTVTLAHEGLMESADHRENILRELFDEVGVGCYEGPYGLMCTQVFRALAV